jgi:hypothetical protein
MVLLIALPLIVLTVVDASGLETNESNTRPFKGIVVWLRGLGQRLGRYGSVEVSEEFKAKAITVTENDPDVQGLLADGYNITRVMPIIKSIVDANGDVTTRATNAIVILKNEDAKSFATVWVDLNARSVTKIVTLTRTVIKQT